MQIRQGVEGSDLSQRGGSITSHLSVGVVLQTIQKTGYSPQVPVIVQKAADHPADDGGLIRDPAKDGIGCLPAVEQGQSLDGAGAFFFVRKLQMGFKQGERFLPVTRQQGLPDPLVSLRIRKSLLPGVEKLPDGVRTGHACLETRIGMML